MAKLPYVGPEDHAAPHVVIVGAGASRAACPNGDRNGKTLPLMTDLIDVVELRPLLNENGLDADVENFETIYSQIVESGNLNLARRLEKRVHSYCASLQLPDSITAYDHLLLSLRPKDLVATFNWDPLIIQAFRRHEGKIALPPIAFLHGNVAFGCCTADRRSGYLDDTCHTCGEQFTPTPLLYPVTKKDYESDPFIQSQWALLQQRLEEAYFLTIFGYSAPATDVAARAAMMTAWKRNETREIAEIDIVDVKSRDELHDNWKEFITREHYITSHAIEKSYLGWHPRRSCDALFAATMMLDPWRDDFLPNVESIEELRNWVRGGPRI